MILFFFMLVQCLLFFIDLCITSYTAFPFFACSLAGCIVGCFAATSYVQCLSLALPTLFHGLLLYGVTGSTTAICLFLLVATRYMLSHLHHQQEIIVGLVALYLGFIIKNMWQLPYQQGLLPYTILICIAILAVTYFSLKWLIAVKRGNRL